MTLADLFDIETAVEENFKSFLVAEGFSVFTRLNASEDFQKVRPRLELRCATQGALLHRALCVDGNERPDQWRFTLVCQIVTAPENVAEDNTLHAAMRAQLRETMSTAAQLSWNDLQNFPNHVVAEVLVETGTVPVTKTKDGLEYSTISWGAVVGIRFESFTLALTS